MDNIIETTETSIIWATTTIKELRRLLFFRVTAPQVVTTSQIEDFFHQLIHTPRTQMTNTRLQLDVNNSDISLVTDLPIKNMIESNTFNQQVLQWADYSSREVFPIIVQHGLHLNQSPLLEDSLKSMILDIEVITTNPKDFFLHLKLIQ